MDTEDMVVGLPQRKLDDLRQRPVSWPPERREATVQEVLPLARKLHHAAYVVRPGWYIVDRLLRLVNRVEGECRVGRLRKKAEAGRRLELTPEFMADVGWWRWLVDQKRWKIGERQTVPFFRFVKQEPSKQWFSDASYQAVGGYCLKTSWWWRYGLSEEEKSWTVIIGSGWAMIASRFKCCCLLLFTHIQHIVRTYDSRQSCLWSAEQGDQMKIIMRHTGTVWEGMDRVRDDREQEG